mmetsp:Transcript_37943/g.73485  ORF Transcript_37943/g.73485 Transcript_37943/m.73485 type:complete len:261 (-) Transcript_37943:380-1162(-)
MFWGISEPRVLQDFLSSHSFLGIALQELSNEISCTFTDACIAIKPRPLPLPEHRVESLDYHIFNFLYFLSRVAVARSERQRPVQDRKHNHSHTPHISGCVVTCLEQNFWCFVVECAALTMVVLVGFDMLSHSEVDYFDDGILGLALKEKVVWLKITVDKSIFVHVSNGTKKLPENFGGLLFTVAVAVFDKTIVKLATFTELHNDVKPLHILKNVIEVDDVRVVHLFHYADLVSERFEVVLCMFGRPAKFRLVDIFDSNLP